MCSHCAAVLARCLLPDPAVTHVFNSCSSAVNNAAGAKTQLAGVITSCVVLLVLLLLTNVFALVPYNVSGAAPPFPC